VGKARANKKKIGIRIPAKSTVLRRTSTTVGHPLTRDFWPLTVPVKAGSHQGDKANPTNKPVTPSIQVQADNAPMRQAQAHPTESRCPTQGSNRAHHRPNRMCEMNKDDCLPPVNPPFNRSQAIRETVANPAEKTAPFRMSFNDWSSNVRP